MWQSHIQHVVNWPRDNKPPLYPWHLKWLRVGWDITHCKEKTYSSFGMECCATGKQFSKGHHGRMKAGFKRSPKSFLNLSDPQPAASWLCVRQHSVWAVRRFGLRLARKLRGHLDIFFCFFWSKISYLFCSNTWFNEFLTDFLIKTPEPLMPMSLMKIPFTNPYYPFWSHPTFPKLSVSAIFPWTTFLGLSYTG